MIYRATSQWFAGMDVVPNEGAARRCARGRWRRSRRRRSTRHWGKARLHGMIANRPDWTLSRQRQWGVPMAFFVHKETGELHPRTPELLEQVAQRVERAASKLAGSSIARRAARTTSRPTTTRTATRSTSGSTPVRRIRPCCAARTRPNRIFPADLYLEGSDQHRGWFHSSLLIGVHAERRAAVQGAADARLRRRRPGPQDEQVARQRASQPQKVADTLGAEIMRLWVASTDYSGELSLSDEILKRVVESVPPHPQHAALPAGQCQRLRSASATACRSSRCSRSTATRWRCCAISARSRSRLRALRVPSDRRATADVLLGRSRRVLSRHPEGPAVHDARRDSKRAARRRRALYLIDRGTAQADGADPVVHRRRGLGGLEANDAGGTIFTETFPMFCPAPATRLH